ncbi:chromosomal replication initiator protein DnaA [Oceanotoga sp. DSM 15011]|uniref:Chromosomal replication initiator protein DnaA n=1 Tax=Oceanotoga teriensis TaxID=515440 RepID=A0AA45C8P9_9BACT|nr:MULTISPECIES: chromosomal replication initiator protein DnaA [Oceanotoga]MDN5342112.1 chromosomal replication initiator protein [Oceanotoga sp.]MDO7975418.1 chromosomal replication initiator protein DnaA [Oceanotoga teriensis]PWJ96294.1 chromosomal replication initiator protein DnaA [Oceanotoga teriensis]UYP00078.1 chromosomal replication initiator protein DnaA [Oceanotoga sp. DSM 15011]
MNKEELHEQLKLNISRETWKNWFNTSQIISMDENEVIIGLGNPFLKDTVEKKFGSIINEKINDILGKNIKVKYQASTIDKNTKPLSGPLIRNRPLKLSEFNPEFTFESFVVGESNRMAYYSSIEASKNPGKFNPLFIYGDVGLGKTHLMHSIANYILEHSPDLRVRYLTAEDFMNEMMDAIRNKQMESFRERFRKTVDILLIDDVQFLIGKNNVQNELFHTFNSLFNAGKQVIICSDRTPDELATFHPRLISRFEMGLVVNIETPDESTRYLIAKKMAQMISLQMSDDVAHYLAEHVDQNLRRLRGAIMNLLLHTKITGEPVSVSSAKKIVDSIVRMNKSKTKYNSKEAFETIKLNTVIDTVIEEFKICREDLYSNSRKKNISEARQVLAYILKIYMKLSVKEISKILKRNHSTISHSIKKIDHSLMLGNNIIKSKIDNIKEKMESEKVDLDLV